MKVLLSGGSGFLGKRVLQLLVADPKISRVHVLSRTKTSHPSSKVSLHEVDLSFPLVFPWADSEFIEECDVIVHLAGLYSFSEPFSTHYKQNVLPILNLVDRIRSIKSDAKPPFIFASTYAIGAGMGEALLEEPLKRLPSESESYAYCKGLAERVLTDSKLSARIFRLGILVGDSHEGIIEKTDGPYHLMRFLAQEKAKFILRKVNQIPFPKSLSGVLPLVPVDAAARVIHRSLGLGPLSSGQQEYFNVVHRESVDARLFLDQLIKEFHPHCELRLLNYRIPKLLMSFQERFTRIPKEVFNYAFNPIQLKNARFVETFGQEMIPHFEAYRKAFFTGFRECYLGERV